MTSDHLASTHDDDSLLGEHMARASQPTPAMPATPSPAQLLAGQAAALAEAAIVFVRRQRLLIPIASEPDGRLEGLPVLSLDNPRQSQLAPVQAATMRYAVLSPGETSGRRAWYRRPHCAHPLIDQDQVLGVLVVIGAAATDLALQPRLAALAALGTHALQATQLGAATHLQAVVEAAQRVVSSLDLNVVMRLAIEQVVAVLRADAASLWLLEPNGVELVVADRLSTIERPLIVDRLSINAPSITAHAARTMTTQVAEQIDLMSDQFSLTRQVLANDVGIKSMACLPLVVREQLVGVLTVMSRRARHFSEADLQTGRALANQVAIAIQNARLFGQVESQQRWLRTVISRLPEGVVVADASDGRILAANPAADRLLGLALDAGKSHLIADLAFQRPDGRRYPPDECPIIQPLRSGTPSLAAELHYQHPNGTTRVLLVNTAPLSGDDGKPHAGVVVFQDITDLKAEQRRRDEFLSIVSHELKTPLTNIRGYADLIRRRLDREGHDAPYQRELGTISSQVERMTRLVNDLLDLSRLAAGHFQIRATPIDLVDIAARAVDHARVAAPYHQISFERPARAALIRGDVGRLEQVLGNLLNNAAKYSPEGSAIVVAVAQDDQEVVVSVRDQGVGIPVDRLANLFERYYRAPGAAGSGLGLGLFICQEIVARHSGRIWVDSVVGQGSTFWLALPLING